MAHGSTCTLAAPARPDGRAARGDRHLWVPRGLGNAGLLLALAADLTAGHPDNATATGRMLGVDRETVRRHRAELLELELVALQAGFLIATDKGLQLLRAGSDPLPRALLRGRGPRPSLAVLRACAVVYSDAVGWRADRRGCRNDAERALLVRVSRPTIHRARLLLAERDLVSIEALRRGRADLRRVRLTADRRATHGSPMREDRAQRLAVAADRGRARLRRGAVLVASGGAVQVASPMQSPTETLPMQGTSPRPADGSEIASLPSGWSLAEPSTARSGRTDTAGDVLRKLLPDAATVVADRQADTTAANDAAAAGLRRLAGDRQAVDRLLRMPANLGCEQLLAVLRVFDRAPRRRSGLAVQVARSVGTANLLALAIDAMLGLPRNLAAVVLERVRRHATGKGEAMTRCRAGWSLARLLDALATPTVAAAPAPRDHDPHRRTAILAAGEAAARGDWARVDALVTRHHLDLDELGVGMVPVAEIREHLARLAAQRLAAFQAGRATA